MGVVVALGVRGGWSWGLWRLPEVGLDIDHEKSFHPGVGTGRCFLRFGGPAFDRVRPIRPQA